MARVQGTQSASRCRAEEKVAKNETENETENESVNNVGRVADLLRTHERRWIRGSSEKREFVVSHPHGLGIVDLTDMSSTSLEGRF